MARGTAPPLNPTLLRDARATARMSQRDLARAVGTTRHQIIRYENGAERPEIGRLAALARACSVTVADLLDEDALPPGLAGLRIGAGLTMAAAATALSEHIDPSTGIATNRASLSGAEKGRLPLSWRPAPAGSHVRGVMAATYEVDIDAVRSAWQATFPDDPHRPPALREEAEQGRSEPGFINAAPNEAATETTPPSLAETATLVWGSNRPASQAWRIRPQEREATVHLELVSPHEREAFELDATRMYRVHQDERLIGFVWRDADSRLWRGASATDDGSLGLVPVISSRESRTRQSVVEILLDPTTTYIGDITPAPDHGQETQDTDQNPEAPGVAVLVSGGPQSAQVYMDGDHVGHLEHRYSWDQQDGWAYRVRLTDTERAHMSPGQQDAPDAVTNLTDIVVALTVLLEEAYGHPVPVTSLSGERTDLPIRGRDMERWELRKGRVSGREDIYVRSRCWGWLQRDETGFTAHTVEGIVSGSPAPTREDAAAALWAHLTAPLPPPLLGERARTRRRLRSHAKLTRPMCPYSPTELARVSVVEAPASKTGARLYQAVAPDGVVLGFLWRSGRGWSRCAPTPQGTMPGSLPVGASFPSRAEALESLLSRPGPLWGDPAEVIVH